jgi:hypothetical protein
MFGVIVEEFDSAKDVEVCAEQPFSELRQARALAEFDSVVAISELDYDLVAQPSGPQNLLYTPDSSQFRGVVHRLDAKPQAVRPLLEPE